MQLMPDSLETTVFEKPAFMKAMELPCGHHAAEATGTPVACPAELPAESWCQLPVV